MKDEDPYGTWCAIASDLKKAIRFFQSIKMNEQYMRDEFIQLIDKCIQSKETDTK